MQRRDFLWLGVALPISAARTKPHRVVAFMESARSEAWLRDYWSGLLLEAGLVEGRDFSLEVVNLGFAPALAQVEEAARKLVATRPAAVCAPSKLAAAVARATREIPVVFYNFPDPVEAGLIQSLARPGGNVTGVSNLAHELNDKRWELLLELRPAIRRIAMVVPGRWPLTLKRARQVTRREVLEISLPQGPVTPEEVEGAVRSTSADAFDLGVWTNDAFSDSLLLYLREAKLPAVYFNVRTVQRGGLAAVGDRGDDHRKVAILVARILRGERAGSIPVEQLTEVLVTINESVARAIGIELTHALRLRATAIVQ